MSNSENFFSGDRGRRTYGLVAKEVVIVFISLITSMWLKKNKVSIINRILKTCNTEVYCIVLPVIFVRSTINFKKKKKSREVITRIGYLCKCKGMIEWGSDV